MLEYDARSNYVASSCLSKKSCKERSSVNAINRSVTDNPGQIDVFNSEEYAEIFYFPAYLSGLLEKYVIMVGRYDSQCM